MIAYYGAFKDAFSKDGFAALTHLKQIQDTAVANLLILACSWPFLHTILWPLTVILADGFIAYENTTIVPSLVKTARGKILELGPGPGNQIHRFDPTVVEFVYAVDPNPHYGDDIAAKLIKSDLQGKYKLLTCGVEDSDVLRSEGIVECSLDTVLSIQVMCAVDDPKSVMREIWRLLKPGGRFVFWEHGKNRDTFTGITQGMYLMWCEL